MGSPSHTQQTFIGSFFWEMISQGGVCGKTSCCSMIILMPWLCCSASTTLQTWCDKVLVMARSGAAAAWGGLISSPCFFSSLSYCCSCCLPITPSLVWRRTRAVVGMGFYCWDLLGDMGCKDNGIHCLCIPEGDGDTRALCGWRRERISCLSLQNTQCLPPPGAPFRSHSALDAGS